MDKWTSGDVTLYCGDCLTVLPTLEQVDAVVTDPPYGTASVYACGKNRDNVAQSIRCEPMTNNDKPFNPTPWLDFSVVVLWGANWYADRLPPSGAWWVWDKRCGGTPDDFSEGELAWTNIGNRTRFFRHKWRGFIRDSERGVPRVHPTQKPIALMRWCIEQIVGYTVLDPFMGSGTTGVACVQTGRRFIGVEIEEKYFEIAKERILKAQQEIIQGSFISE